jgi:hypothetical protein
MQASLKTPTFGACKTGEACIPKAGHEARSFMTPIPIK